jgi:DNA-binding NarL/FixJ family response regulator
MIRIDHDVVVDGGKTRHHARHRRPGSLTMAPPQAPLSPRQREVLGLLARGVRAREIGSSLGLSEATVRNHIREVLRRLDCHSQLQAVARARERHLI